MRLFRSSARPRTALAPVLLASTRAGDFGQLEALLRDSKWALARAMSWPELDVYCRSAAIPIVLLDVTFGDSGWHDGLSSLPNRPAVILLSDISDPQLWSEFVRIGGFEILPRPFDREELIGSLAFALRHRETRWPDLSPRAPISL